MNEHIYTGNETGFRNEASAGQTIQLNSMTDGIPLQGSFQPNWSGIILTLSLFGVILMFAIKQMFGSGPFKQSIAAFKRSPIAARIAALSILLAIIAYGGAKPETNEMERVSRPLAVLMSSGEQMASIPEAVQLTESQQLAGFALTAVVTNETFDLSAPTNAVVHANWLKRGAAEDGFWIPIAPFSLGTNRFDSVYVSSSGTLSFNHPKSSPLARLMPDGSSIAFLAPLQTVLGIPPEANWNLLSATNSLFWHDVTTYGSARFTWQNALLNRATNAPLTFQTELFPSGDFIYRYDFSSLTLGTLPLASDFVMGAQNNGGGETSLIATDTHSCSGTNHLCALLYRLDGTNVLTAPLCSVATNAPKFSLYWTAFGELDPSDPDPDDDGITTSDEVLLYHTNPLMPDSDLDGVSDGDELAIGTNPLDPDGDNDGIPDGLDVQPLVWNDAGADSDGDGLSLAEELLQGLDPAVADDIDTDGDGWEDWKEALAGTSPTDFNDRPVNADSSTKIFDVTIASGYMSGASVLLAVGDHRMIFGASATSYTLTLREGIAHPVSLYAATDCSVALTYTLGSSYAVFRNPHPLFSGVGTLSGGRIALSGMIAQPVPSIVPDPLCFHTRDDIHVDASVLPEGMTGNWSWWMACEPWTGDGNEVDLPYDEIDYPNYFESGFLAHGAASSRWVARTVTRCALLDEHPEWLESDFDPVPPYPAEEPLGDSETGGPGFDAYGSELLIPVNNDDDNANESLDTADGEMSVADNDLVGYYPLGYFTGECCPCPEHQVQYAESATLLSSSSHLALWKDACKSDAFTGTNYAGEVLYVEGLSESASVGAEEIVWQYASGGQTHQLTNVFTVLSQRIFGDLDFDDDIDTADKALHGSLSTTNGWVMPVATNVFRMTQLQTDVDVPGVHMLSLSGNAFRVWQSAAPSTNDAPLIVSGQTVTNGVNGVSWGMNHTANVFIQAVTNGTATLTYSYIGTGSASGIVCRASMKLTALNFGIVPDYDRDGVIEADDRHRSVSNETFRIWINDDADVGDTAQDGGSDLPGQGEDANFCNSAVDGRCDLLDFFPIWLDISDVLALCPPSAGYQYRLRHGQSAINGVLTDLYRQQAGEYITTATNTYGLAGNQSAHSATAINITASGVDIPSAFLARIAQDADKGVILLEGREWVDGEPIRLEVMKSGQKVFEIRLALSVFPVEEMMDRINLRTSPPGIISGSGASSSNGKHVIFVHGYKVDEAESVAWGAEIFKRLWQRGSNAKFHNVDWNGNEGVSNGALDYHGNVANALEASSALRSYVNSLSGEKILMAHSLGNMVVSAAIDTYGMDADKYFMLNAAVAAEGCDSGLFDESPSNVMVHEDWQNITNTCWSAKYHELFAGTGDDRRNLTWKNFFANILTFTTVYNVWSSGDEVLELYGGTPYSTTGVFDSMGRYSWHKQEIHKGRGALDPAGTSWAGWGIEDPSYTFLNPLIYTNQPPTQAEVIEMMKLYPLFLQEPTMLFSSSITISDRDALLAGAIPALSGPMGTRPISFPPGTLGQRNFDMDTAVYKADGGVWPDRGEPYKKRWLHSDLKNMAYFYVHKLFNKLVDEGELR